MGGLKPLELYEKAIDEALIGSLRQDARITDDILGEVKGIFLALPPHVQSRVLLRAIKHPTARAYLNGEAVQLHIDFGFFHRNVSRISFL